MKKDIILGGVGGQGILTIATVIGMAALSEGLQLKQSEVHGMSQRGGDVQSNLRISSDPIASDLIPEGKADMILAVEPLESLRYFNMLNRETGWLITSINPFKNIPDYPPLEEVLAEITKLPRYITIDADRIAQTQGSVKAANIVVLGAASPFIGLKYESLENAVRQLFGKKGEEIVNLNLQALKAGRDFAEENR
ncbi:indolepyruvate oxidoreductase subunit beta [Candidatus Sulfidibacterium hydrothermale]|uniref:indolepyruvate oxidoreductase subunit beta n=1 Tax=Candidatus Sulfidibacterium hydrothermale TaxID=2875962 RepID=UPI001F0AA05E|nr:indolepyruvate oxidoreductase subunit beta [Candidatus Sulfidibacterium hydrothermale]UBM63053.1 indolepyruvate oxidoreductase subunit beta [Candidatus Sulfidibacterium hydrothermale]